MKPLVGYHLRFSARTRATLPREMACGLVDDLVRITGLTRLGPMRYEDQAVGFSAIQMIAESHVSLEQTGEALFADVFSCSNFDAGACISVIRSVCTGGWSADFTERREDASCQR